LRLTFASSHFVDRLLSFRLPSRSLRPLLLPLLAGVVGISGCDRLKAAIRPSAGVDLRWQGDSTVLASKPEFLFRVKRTGNDVRVVPLTTIGSQGFRPLFFGNRGWRAFDLQYLQKGLKVTAHRDGRPAETVEMIRGMWEPPSDPLDTIVGCAILVANGRAQVPPGVTLMASSRRAAPRSVKSLSDGELQDALRKVTQLIAPTAGISGSNLSRYKREVHVVQSGVSEWPSILVVFDDPEPLADSVSPLGQRPRHLIVILDRGRYGYRQSYSYSTVANRKSPPRLVFLDYLDVDDDGRAELFFGLRNPPTEFNTMYTFVLHFDNEAWRERLRLEAFPCQEFQG
jgi:hypothetical protein